VNIVGGGFLESPVELGGPFIIFVAEIVPVHGGARTGDRKIIQLGGEGDHLSHIQLFLIKNLGS